MVLSGLNPVNSPQGWLNPLGNASVGQDSCPAQRWRKGERLGTQFGDGPGSFGPTVGLKGLRGLFQPGQFYFSVGCCSWTWDSGAQNIGFTLVGDRISSVQCPQPAKSFQVLAVPSGLLGVDGAPWPLLRPFMAGLKQTKRRESPK